MDKWFNTPDSPERQKSIGYGSFDSTVDTLAGFLRDKKYAIGNRFTVLDVYLSGFIMWAVFRAQVLPTDGGLAAYMQYHAARPAFARAQRLDEELAKQMGLA